MRKLALTWWTIELRLCQIVSLPQKGLKANRQVKSYISIVFKVWSNITEVLTTSIQDLSKNTS